MLFGPKGAVAISREYPVNHLRKVKLPVGKWQFAVFDSPSLMWELTDKQLRCGASVEVERFV